MNKFVKFNGRLIAYKVSGEGPPLVFLHGFLEDMSIWDNIQSILKNTNKIVLVDLPGHGKTESTEKVETMHAMAEAVKTVCINENIYNPIVFGHSMGGYVALELDKIFKINPVLIHSNFWADSTSKKTDRNRVVEVVKKNLPLFVNTAIPNLFYSKNRKLAKKDIFNLINKANGLNPSALISVIKGMRDRHDNSKVFENSKISIIQGVNDEVISKLQMVKQLKLVKNNFDYYEIDECGHMCFVEQPEQFLKLIKIIIDKFSLLKSNN